MSTDFRPLADALRAELAKPFAEEDVIERVAVEIENIFQEHAFGKALEQMSQKAAAAAIAAHSAYLRERAQDDDVVEAAAQAHINNELDQVMIATPTFQELGEVLWMRELGNTQHALTAALDAMLGEKTP